MKVSPGVNKRFFGVRSAHRAVGLLILLTLLSTQGRAATWADDSSQTQLDWAIPTASFS